MTFSQASAAETSGLAVGFLGQMVLLGRPRDRGVRGDQSGQSTGSHQADDLIQRVERQVRGHLDEDRLGGFALGQFGIHRLHRRQDVVQRRLVLELPQVGRVR